MSDPHAHVRPEPIEAPAPNVRRRDLVRYRALIHGYNVLCADQPALITFGSFKAGAEAVLDYLSAHDRRRR